MTNCFRRSSPELQDYLPNLNINERITETHLEEYRQLVSQALQATQPELLFRTRDHPTRVRLAIRQKDPSAQRGGIVSRLESRLKAMLGVPARRDDDGDDGCVPALMVVVDMDMRHPSLVKTAFHAPFEQTRDWLLAQDAGCAIEYVAKASTAAFPENDFYWVSDWIPPRGQW
jgi:hypothetical protein